MQVVIPEAIIETLVELARETAPKEMMILLQGRMTKEKIQVTNLIYQHVAADPHTAIMTEGDATTNIVGSCHSHPGNSKPSAQDKRYFNKNPGIHLIIGKPYTRTSISCYTHLGSEISFIID